MTTGETELTAPVTLCDDRGRLALEARGWSRRPQLTANLRGARGRKKRWDYWCIITDEIVVSFVHADVDYAGLTSVWVMVNSVSGICSHSAWRKVRRWWPRQVWPRM